ncbi:sensor histidine kinase [Lentibacillus saliphilus]|uniref:sensor histidine kinase n=1 Tax=Lentibacillus saliphilus TaxID=2737028 RepID=UPI001C304A6D|nr:HAMP domain-containing sensor histidine kinase [Lentibacillus saliphilus]
MWRNKEFRWLTVASIVVTGLAVLLAAFFPAYSVWIVIGLAVFVLIFMLLGTAWRYQEIKKLSTYLRNITNGNYTLDVRDNAEGELSILKNEIYKVTNRLSEQSSLLKADKVHLSKSISDISHQLKTPLTSMRVMTDLLEDPNLPEDKRIEFTHNIHTQLERLDWLVTALLKLSKIDAGTAHFKRERVSVADVVNQALAPLSVPIDVKNIVVTIEGDAAISFLGDFNWTTEALVNIVKNCIEHTPEGGALSIRYSENVLFTEICIRDTGVGIPKEERPHIFNRFHKGKHASADSVGIGLAMAHSIISAQDGTIDVDSEEGHGTQFSIKFYKQVI